MTHYSGILVTFGRQTEHTFNEKKIEHFSGESKTMCESLLKRAFTNTVITMLVYHSVDLSIY